MKVLVTGAAGFIGQHTVRLLEQEGYEVIALDIDHIKMEGLKCLHKIRGDIRNSPLIDALISEYKPEAVIHLAAQSSVVVSMLNPSFDAEINIIGTMNIIQSCQKYGVERIVFASSGGCVYGEPHKLPVDENAYLNPMSPYGASKLAGEFYIRCSGMEYMILRYPNVYGPGQDHRGPSGIVAIFIGNILLGKACEIYGDGGHTKDYVYVEDVARANVMALECGTIGTFNIGSGKEYTVSDIFGKISSKMKKYSPKSPEHLASREGDVKRFSLNATKAKHLMGWSPTVSLDEGIRKTIDFMSQGALDAEGTHNPFLAGSNPAPATKYN